MGSCSNGRNWWCLLFPVRSLQITFEQTELFDYLLKGLANKKLFPGHTGQLLLLHVSIAYSYL